jgi:histidinol-phosphate/aromatic aminotransferase/cobyric acid decarboxylase-like protein
MMQTKLTKNRISKKAASFTESVIREMTREAVKYEAVNLGQGFPDFAAPEDIKRKAQEAIAADHNQYAITWGVKSFRDAIVEKTKWFLNLDVDAETEITVTCGSTEGMIAGMLATVDAGEKSSSSSRFTKTTRPTRFCQTPCRFTFRFIKRRAAGILKTTNCAPLLTNARKR